MENQGRNAKQYEQSAKAYVVGVMVLIAISIILFLGLAGCATTKQNLPFATTNRVGKYPVKTNKPVRNNSTWCYRQWGHQGN
jgi:hypothetical protein